MPPDGESIVMVTPELAVSTDFKSFITRLKATRQLDRVVIDECHVVLNDQKIIDRKHIDGLTAIAMDPNEGEPGPIILQGDHRHVEIRKVVLTPLTHK